MRRRLGKVASRRRQLDRDVFGPELSLAPELGSVVRFVLHPQDLRRDLFRRLIRVGRAHGINGQDGCYEEQDDTSSYTATMCETADSEMLQFHDEATVAPTSCGTNAGRASRLRLCRAIWRYGDMAIWREGGGSASHQTGDRRCGFVDLVLCLWSASMHGVGDAMSEVIVQ